MMIAMKPSFLVQSAPLEATKSYSGLSDLNHADTFARRALKLAEEIEGKGGVSTLFGTSKLRRYCHQAELPRESKTII